MGSLSRELAFFRYTVGRIYFSSPLLDFSDLLCYNKHEIFIWEITMKIQAVIFDMDGTLVDSLISWDLLWKDIGVHFLNDREVKPSE